MSKRYQIVKCPECGEPLPAYSGCLSAKCLAEYWRGQARNARKHAVECDEKAVSLDLEREHGFIKAQQMMAKREAVRAGREREGCDVD